MKGKTAIRLRSDAYSRAALPNRAQPHFVYKAKSPDVNPADMTRVSDVVCDWAQTKLSRSIGDVAQLRLSEFRERASNRASEALDRMIGVIGPNEAADFSLLACEWAAPHDDCQFLGRAFASLVLHTGPFPYVLTMMNSRKCGQGLALEQRSRELKRGDFFVFDPSTPHMAAPSRPHQDSLLVLLQADVSMADSSEQDGLLKSFPRHPIDVDCFDH
jgi:hypothetical protein